MNQPDCSRLEVVDQLSQAGWQQIDDDSWTHAEFEDYIFDTEGALKAQDGLNDLYEMAAKRDAYMAQFSGE